MVEVIALHFAPVEAARRQKLVEDAPVQAVDVGPRQPALTHLGHGWLVTGAPVFGEGGPVDPSAGARIQGLASLDDRAAPIDDGAEDVET